LACRYILSISKEKEEHRSKSLHAERAKEDSKYEIEK
jgi:hypothetical protein